MFTSHWLTCVFTDMHDAGLDLMRVAYMKDYNVTPVNNLVVLLVYSLYYYGVSSVTNSCKLMSI